MARELIHDLNEGRSQQGCLLGAVYATDDINSGVSIGQAWGYVEFSVAPGVLHGMIGINCRGSLVERATK